MIGNLIAAWLDVRSKPLRTAAAIAGMVAAIVAVVVVDGAGVLSRAANDDYVARRYGLPVTFSIASAGGPVSPADTARLVRLLRTNGVTAVSVNTQFQTLEDRETGFRPGGALWVSSAYPEIRVVELLGGDWPVETARSSVAHAVISMRKAEERQWDERTAIGQVIGFVPANSPDGLTTDDLRPMVVDGVAANSSNAFAGAEVLIVSDLEAPPFVPAELLGGGWLARVNPADIPLLFDIVVSVTGTDGTPLFDYRRIDQTEDFAPVLEQQAVTARAVTLVAFAVGGLGILGVGLASVRERSKDFGLRRALGASKGRIFGGVIVQTLLEVLLAAALGIFLAAIVLEAFARDLVLETLPLPASTALPVASALRGLLGALVVGLAAGLIPAISAARASVVQALKG